MGRITVVSITKRYVLDSSGAEFQEGRDFPHTSITAVGPTQLPVQWVTGLFPRGKAAGTRH